MRSLNDRKAMAAVIIDSPLFKESFDAVEASIVGRFKLADSSNKEEIQSLTLELQLLERIKSAITSQIELGKIVDFNEGLSSKVR